MNPVDPVHPLVRWLLDLRTLSPWAEGVEFSFTRPLPGWGWALVAIGAGVLAWWTYRRLEASRPARVALASVRTLLLILVVLLIAGPRLIKPNETEEKDWVLVLADRSASVGVRDAGSPDAGARITRDEQLQRALADAQPMWSALARERVLVWLGFDSGVFDLAPNQAPTPGDSSTPGSPVPGSGVPDLGEPQGRRTDLGRALEDALRRSAARPVAGIVVLSDGRSIDEPPRGLLRRLQSARIPVFTVPLGSPEPARDVAIREVVAPPAAFVNDLVPVEVEVEGVGAQSGTGSSGSLGTLELVDTATGTVLDRQRVDTSTPANDANDSPDTPGETRRRVTLTARPRGESGSSGAQPAGAAGPAKWAVRLIPDGPDLVPENNTGELSLNLEDRPLRVLYLDGVPRWEYRYLKNLLVRESSIRSTSMVVQPGRRFVQEGDPTLVPLPASPEEWRQFDVVMIGDVNPDIFGPEQLRQLRDHVGINGAGLVWIGGEGHTPTSWASTPLADLIPFVLSSSDGLGGGAGGPAGFSEYAEPVLVRPTPAAERLGVLRLRSAPPEEISANGAGQPEADRPGWARFWPESLTDPTLGWSALRWAQRIEAGALKPASETLAVADPERASASGGERANTPLVVSMRFGAGRVLYVATDEIWRWRFGRGEDLPERFWLQLIRFLGRDSLARSGKPARLIVSPRRADVERPVRITGELLDQRLADAAPASLRVKVVPVAPRGARGEDADPREGVSLALVPVSGASGPVAPSVGGPRAYSATFASSEPGRYRVEMDDPLLAGERLSAEFEFFLPDDELRRPETDHALLARLSQATGGQVLTPDSIGRLSELLPNRRVRVAGTPEEDPLWDTPLALILVGLLLTTEWIGRRLIKLA